MMLLPAQAGLETVNSIALSVCAILLGACAAAVWVLVVRLGKDAVIRDLHLGLEAAVSLPPESGEIGSTRLIRRRQEPDRG